MLFKFQWQIENLLLELGLCHGLSLTLPFNEQNATKPCC